MAEGRFQNTDWEDDEELQNDIKRYVMQNLSRKEILNFVNRDYPQYAWSLPTLSRRMRAFEIKYVDYNLEVEDVQEAVRSELDGPGKLLGYRAMQRKVREQHGLAVPRSLVYNVMTDIDQAGLQTRGHVAKKRRRGPTGTFTSLVI
jgi:hypothetical protein